MMEEKIEFWIFWEICERMKTLFCGNRNDVKKMLHPGPFQSLTHKSKRRYISRKKDHLFQELFVAPSDYARIVKDYARSFKRIARMNRKAAMLWVQ